ncbi:MAG: hypothetical protein M1832_005564 [Thelocarpon impressellum]|nr:MAG: hypothetical protein M1832_005564 [Thelocarpon impressellum]
MAMDQNYADLMAAYASRPRGGSVQSLRDAGRAGDIELVQHLLDPLRSLPDDWSQALYGATTGNQPATMRYLLAHGAAVDGRVVEAACEAKSTAVFQVLLENGWDVNAQYKQSTVLVAMIRELPLVEWLLDHGAQPCLGRVLQTNVDDPVVPQSGDALNAAAAVSSVEVFKLLLERGARLDWAWPLHAAAHAGRGAERIPMMAFLLELGVDVNSYNPAWPFYHGTPLIHCALHRGPNTASRHFLEQHGADPHIKDRWGQSGFQMARQENILDSLYNPWAPEYPS